MTWAHVTEDGLIDWISEVEQEGLIQLNLPVLEAGEQMRLVNGAVVIEQENEEETEEADALVSRMAKEMQEAHEGQEGQDPQEIPTLTEEQLQELPEEARKAYLAWQAGELQLDELLAGETQARRPGRKPPVLFHLLDHNTKMPPKLFPGRDFTKAHEFTGDFLDWVFLQFDPTDEQKDFITDYCRGRKFDALFLCCPCEGQRVSFADVLVGTDKVMLHKEVLQELEEAGIATSGLPLRRALFKSYCTAHCGVCNHEDHEIRYDSQIEKLFAEAVELLEIPPETLGAIEGGAE